MNLTGNDRDKFMEFSPEIWTSFHCMGPMEQVYTFLIMSTKVNFWLKCIHAMNIYGSFPEEIRINKKRNNPLTYKQEGNVLWYDRSLNSTGAQSYSSRAPKYNCK